MRGYTVEMSFLMPILLLLIMSSIFGAFYYHDKNVIASAAYETVVQGSNKARERDGVEAEELEALFQERIKDKCILFAGAEVSVSVEEDEIVVNAKASKNKMAVTVEKRMPVTDPEKRIREIKKGKDLLHGKDSNN